MKSAYLSVLIFVHGRLSWAMNGLHALQQLLFKRIISLNNQLRESRQP